LWLVHLIVTAIKISSEGKSKVQAQLVLNSGATVNLHFANPMGLEQQLKERDAMKDLVQQLLPRFRTTVSKELEEKNK
jgi:transcription initiation factor TFIIH subunit 1